MSVLTTATLEKVDHFIDRIVAINSDVQVHPDTRDALAALERFFQVYRAGVENVGNPGTDPLVASNYCDFVLSELFSYLPYLGFLHRAQSASNPFEVHGPLKRLARAAIADDVRLIMSSEWEFSPFVHPSLGELQEFVLLGLPATEAENALLMPIAGHEFGHPIWRRYAVGDALRPQIQQTVLDRLRERWKDVSAELKLTDESELSSTSVGREVRRELERLLEQQCEEIFCDLAGLWLFSDSYAAAFSHLIAPGLSGQEPASYPTARFRAEIMLRTAPIFGVALDSTYADAFLELPTPSLQRAVLQAALLDVLPALQEAVKNHHESRSVDLPTAEGCARALDAFREARPASAVCSLPEVLCAAWEVAKISPWSSHPHLDQIKTPLVANLILKSAQAADFWYFVRERANA